MSRGRPSSTAQTGTGHGRAVVPCKPTMSRCRRGATTKPHCMQLHVGARKFLPSEACACLCISVHIIEFMYTRQRGSVQISVSVSMLASVSVPVPISVSVSVSVMGMAHHYMAGVMAFVRPPPPSPRPCANPPPPFLRLPLRFLCFAGTGTQVVCMLLTTYF